MPLLWFMAMFMYSSRRTGAVLMAAYTRCVEGSSAAFMRSIWIGVLVGRGVLDIMAAVVGHGYVQVRIAPYRGGACGGVHALRQRLQRRVYAVNLHELSDDGLALVVEHFVQRACNGIHDTSQLAK